LWEVCERSEVWSMERAAAAAAAVRAHTGPKYRLPQRTYRGQMVDAENKCGWALRPTFEEPRDRLYSAEVCESYFSKVEVQGLPDILYPCVAQQPGGMRDEVQQACFQKCKDENPANPCTTACNCAESTRVKEWAASEWKNVPGCAGEEMQCCRETKDGYTCVNCED